MTPAPTILQKLLPMLASDNEGEVIASVRAIRRALGRAGMDLHDLARMVTAPYREPPRAAREREAARPNVDLERGYAQIAEACEAGLKLNEWERGFIADTALRVRAGYPLSDRQRAVYERLRHLAEVHLEVCRGAAA